MRFVVLPGTLGQDDPPPPDFANDGPTGELSGELSLQADAIKIATQPAARRPKCLVVILMGWVRVEPCLEETQAEAESPCLRTQSQTRVKIDRVGIN
jgi:hypothetical protein